MAALLVVALGRVVALAAAPTLGANRVRHVATSSVTTCSTLVRLRRWWDVNKLVISFGSRAVSGRPMALRARLATGVPLSGICECALSGAAAF
jgi:hypothetical protein